MSVNPFRVLAPPEGLAKVLAAVQAHGSAAEARKTGNVPFPYAPLIDPSSLSRRAAELESRAAGRSPAGESLSASTGGAFAGFTDFAAWLAEEQTADPDGGSLDLGPLFPAQRDHLAALNSPGAAFVVTGQQPGFLGGPLLWLHKAWTCLAAARQASRILGRPVIPLFWIAGDDADVREVNRCEWLHLPAGHPAEGMPLTFAETSRPLSVARRRFAAADLDAAWKRYEGVLSPDSLKVARSVTRPGDSFSTAFRRLAQRLLGNQGLLFVDGASPRVRARSQAVLRSFVAEAPAWEARLRASTQAWEAAGGKAQVRLTPGKVHAFGWTDWGRERLAFPLPAKAGSALELTHSALSRPFVLESLLPVLGHVLGPAELRYFAQLPEAFRQATGSLPLLWPRLKAMGLPADPAAALAAAGFGPEAWPMATPAALRSVSERRYREQSAPGRARIEAARRTFAEAVRLGFDDEGGDARALPAWERSVERGLGKLFRGVDRRRGAPPPAARAALRFLGEGREQDRHLNVFSLLEALGGESRLPGYLEALQALEPGIQGGVYG